MKFYKTTRIDGSSWYDPSFVYKEGRIYRPRRGTIANRYYMCTSGVLHASRTPEGAATSTGNIYWPFLLWSFDGTPVVEDSQTAGFWQVGPMVREDVSFCFGPNGRLITDLLERVPTLTLEQWDHIATLYMAAHQDVTWNFKLTAREAARSAVRNASWRAERGAARAVARGAANVVTNRTSQALRENDASPTVLDIARRTIWDAAQALVVVDLDQYGLEDHHFDALLYPLTDVLRRGWVNVDDHPLANVLKADRTQR